jgi:rod shape-determining protein MreD
MRHVLLLVLTYAAFALQLSIAPEVAIAGCRPQFPLLLLIALPLAGCRAGLLWAAAWGLMSDCCGTDALGIDVSWFVLAAASVQRLGSRGRAAGPWHTSVLTLGVTAVAVAGSTATRLWLAHADLDFSGLAIHAAGAGLYAAALAWPLALLARILPRFHTAASSSTARSPRVVNRWRMLTE